MVFPLRVTWQVAEASGDVQKAGIEVSGDVQKAVNEVSGDAPQVLIWAPKSLFKHAVERNRLRRQMREAYRLEKAPLVAYCAERHVSMQLAFNYMDREMRDFATIRKAIRRAIAKIIAADHA